MVAVAVSLFDIEKEVEAEMEVDMTAAISFTTYGGIAASADGVDGAVVVTARFGRVTIISNILSVLRVLVFLVYVLMMPGLFLTACSDADGACLFEMRIEYHSVD